MYHVDFSDHALVFATLAQAKRYWKKLTEPQKKYTKRRWNPNSVADFPAQLQRAMKTLCADSIGNMWKEWEERFTTALDTVTPAVVSLRKEIKPQCPWMTPELLNILHNQKSMYRRVVRSKRQYLRAVREYRQLRNYNLYKQLKNNYFQQRLLN